MPPTVPWQRLIAVTRDQRRLGATLDGFGRDGVAPAGDWSVIALRGVGVAEFRRWERMWWLGLSFPVAG